MSLEDILKVGIGFLGGGLSVKVFDWWAAKTKDDKQRRREQIADWRAWLSTLPDNGGWSCEGSEEKKILRSAEFQSLEPHLDADLVTRLRRQRTIMVGFDINRILSKRIGELEKEWGLL